MKKFIVINEGFKCQNCSKDNEKLRGSCRNHCGSCLFSLHLDENSPGDRKSLCHGLMQPTRVNQDGKKGWIITHKCLKCGAEKVNKMAEDDNFDKIIEVSQNLNPPKPNE
ncbi:RNHCP domain-containing protein [Candidatus Peregrinibacteria bacterium]|nr:RNHCP domain-containing protein [Candidatus Peregrinibacteria bacterium]